MMTSTTACSEMFLRDTPNTPTVEMPVNVYLLKFSNPKDLSARYTKKDVKELFEEVNDIWSKLGFIWTVDSVETVQVGENSFSVPPDGFSSPREFRDAIADVIPNEKTGRWRVYIVNQFPIKGSSVYIVEKGAVVYGELNKSGERYPVILAHELGHSLGLRHEKSPDNLMYGGPEKNPERTMQLSDQQIKRAKGQAGLGPFKRRQR